MNAIDLLDLVLQAFAAIAAAGPTLETDVTDLVADLTAAYQELKGLILSFTSPSTDQITRVQNLLASANGLNTGKKA